MQDARLFGSVNLYNFVDVMLSALVILFVLSPLGGCNKQYNHTKRNPVDFVDNLRNEFGYCEPLTEQFLVDVFRKGFEELLHPSLGFVKKSLRYDLYTKRNPNKRQILYPGDRETLLNSNFNISWPVRFSLHGWNGKTTTCSNAAIKDAYLATGDFNIILVDWSDYSIDINYVRVVNEIYEIAFKFNQFTRFLHEITNIRYEDIYLIGHSAGSHIAGMAGKLLKPNRYGVIYALDTAGPVHITMDKNWRLTPNDAIYVESIQTDIALFGFPEASLAHASFFPNWGLGQPHCPNVTNMEPYFSCDHFSAIYYFVESIRNPKAFGAIKCKNYKDIQRQKCNCGGRSCKAAVYMAGEPAEPKRGVFYLSTRPRKPFGYGPMCNMKRPLQPTLMRMKYK